MSLNYDLHSHSTASDGTLAPEQLVRSAKLAGVDVLALTDHDTLEGIATASEEAEKRGIGLIPGVEVSVTWNGRTVHILGLRVDHRSAVLRQGLDMLVKFRDWRAQEMGRRLARHRIEGAFDGARALSNGRLISRTHFARFMVSAGHVTDVRSVFKKFLVPGKPGFVPGEWATLEDAVGWIRQAGGDAVIAHPARYRLTRSKLRKLIRQFKDAGGVGLEVVSGSHSKDEYFTMARHARDFDMQASSGSDYHGPENPWIELGQLPDLPDGCVPIWEGWKQ